RGEARRAPWASHRCGDSQRRSGRSPPTAPRGQTPVTASIRSSPSVTRPSLGTTGRRVGADPPRRSSGTYSPRIGLPHEESHGPFQDLTLCLQITNLPPQPPQLLPLARGQPVRTL